MLNGSEIGKERFGNGAILAWRTQEEGYHAGGARCLYVDRAPSGVEMALRTDVKSPLHETVSTTATDYWNDSCSIEELKYYRANFIRE